ncbi:LIM/homeobox protein Lhx9 isoform X3 [Elephas maximus indicus]|uniref:LIM/homeobox protein Lhx9 isoform X3 n=1 Tax=Elephas maximus indicus TaxID=99487 RepID=UPI0021165A23|nr:LIM/homeobox protein Lhx9 isoform X3 [Elephas maximus indicus]
MGAPGRGGGKSLARGPATSSRFPSPRLTAPGAAGVTQPLANSRQEGPSVRRGDPHLWPPPPALPCRGPGSCEGTSEPQVRPGHPRYGTTSSLCSKMLNDTTLEAAMLFHGISGGHIQGIMEEMERRSKTEARLAKGAQLNGRDAGMPPLSPEKPALCAGCGGKISDRYYLLAVDKQWHLRCLKCCECKLALESELTCFAKDGSIYCKEDYYRRFSVQRCARCHLGISASEMVMRARDSVYHLSCFTCSTCNKTLTTGDHFGMKDSLVYCRAHFETLLQGEYPPQLSYTELAAKSGGLALPYFNGTGTVQKGRPRKRKSPALGVDMVNYNSGCNENEADHLDRDQQPYPPSQKTKRMRTSFKHHQLRTMKSYFAINHNPDAKDLKQLAQKTGLTKRVLQGEQILGHYSQTSRRLKIP